MPSSSRGARSPSDLGRQAASSDLLEHLARLGFAVKGLVYSLIGVLAVRAAIGAGGQTTGSRGAITSLADEPFGQVLLGIIAVGTASYAVWRFVEAIGDPDGEGTDAKGIAKRAGYAGSGLIYAGLSVFTFRLLLGNGGGSGGDQQAASMTATVMQQPYGPWLVGLAGAITVGIALFQLKRAVTADFFKRFKQGRMNAREKRWTKRIGRFGIAARGVVFGVVGVFLIQAALQADPAEARGLGGALDALAAQPYGPYLLGGVALGLVAYGLYCFVAARYRRLGSAHAA